MYSKNLLLLFFRVFQSTYTLTKQGIVEDQKEKVYSLLRKTFPVQLKPRLYFEINRVCFQIELFL